MTSRQWFHFTMARRTTGKRETGRILEAINHQVMERHRDERLQRHFEENDDTKPGGAYGYKKRGGKYLNRKQKKVGHKRPNVFTGELRASVLSRCKITATQHGSKLRTSGTPTHRLQNFQRREIEAMSLKERHKEAKRCEKDFVKFVKSGRFKSAPRKKVIK